MIEADSRQDLLAIENTSSSITRGAFYVCRGLYNGKENVEVSLVLPRRKAIHLSISIKIKHEFLFHPKYTWKVNFIDNNSPCKECQRRIGKLRGEARGVNNLINYLNEIMKIINSHYCMTIAVGSLSEEKGQMAEARAGLSTAKTRIKVLNQDLATDREKVPASVIKVLKPSDLANETGSNEKQEAEERAYNVPGIRYQLASGIHIDITIPLQICEALVTHCDMSNQHGREIGGILIGYKHEIFNGDTGIPDLQILVTDILPVHSSDSSSNHIRLNESDWLNIEWECQSKYTPQRKTRLGWYHTHPTQGIFFSPQDLDAHTVFNKPYQFALVVNPKQMEAGLFYWNDYSKQDLSGPWLFKLVRERENELYIADSREDKQSESIKRELSFLRLYIFLTFFIILLACIALKSKPFAIDPNHACILALVILTGFRLWNVGIFHSETMTEMNVSKKLDHLLRSGANATASLLRPILSRFGHVISLVFITLLLISTFCLFLYNLHWQRSLIPAGSSVNEIPVTDTGAANHRNAKSQNAIKVFIEKKNDTQLIMETTDDKQAQLVYIKSYLENGESKWIANFKREKIFFREVFQLNISSDRKDKCIQQLQRELGMQSSDTNDKQADGKWGGATRQAFVEKAQDLKLSGAPLRICLPQGNQREVLFSDKH